MSNTSSKAKEAKKQNNRTFDTLWNSGFMMGVEFGVRSSEAGHNLQAVLIAAKKLLKRVSG